ncbi:uncharacterized protein LOC131649073 [Vicia villosa]|uniref:uncharacterized protein LOC131649073 n=1 Tax=Vicia villosa TaxID=3911 RepID=UPI00273B45F4|nr:uncharacterized protein LOC131649073 [Vicia villosa]
MEDYECRAINGEYIQFSSLKELYVNHLVAATESEEEGDGIFVEYNRGCALRCWFMFLSWIISYFHYIHNYDLDPSYTDTLPRSARYVLQRGNKKVRPYRVDLDHTAHNDIQWTPFRDYGDVVPFDRIALYSGWLACGANSMVRYLPERCMRQFGRVQMIPRSPFEATPDTVTYRDLAIIFEDWAHHLVSEEYRRMRATQS